jgi:hypothetical protein
MADRLEGVGFRVFRSLHQEWDLDTVEDIRIQLTRGPLVPFEQIEAALARLAERRYVEEFKPGHWKITNQGLAVKRSLLGEAGR